MINEARCRKAHEAGAGGEWQAGAVGEPARAAIHDGVIVGGVFLIQRNQQRARRPFRILDVDCHRRRVTGVGVNLQKFNNRLVA